MDRLPVSFSAGSERAPQTFLVPHMQAGLFQGLAPARPGSAEARRRSSWARMLRKVFEVDPLLCPQRGEEKVMEGEPCRIPVAWITKVDVIGRSLRYRREKGVHSPFEP